MPRAGLEPAQPYGRRILSPLRLPISPPRRRIFQSLEAAPGLEPGIRVLQTHALPLGYAAFILKGLTPYSEIVAFLIRFCNSKAVIIAKFSPATSCSSGASITIERYSCCAGPVIRSRSVSLNSWYHSAIPPS